MSMSPRARGGSQGRGRRVRSWLTAGANGHPCTTTAPTILYALRVHTVRVYWTRVGWRPTIARDLTPRQVQILLVLLEAPLHGYAIGKEIEARTGGTIVLKPGSMYRALQQLLDRGYTEEVDTPGTDDERRRAYRITRVGRERLREALEDYRGLVREGERSGLVPEDRP
jgi:DNA-binding PadR family transcriptional regulator